MVLMVSSFEALSPASIMASAAAATALRLTSMKFTSVLSRSKITALIIVRFHSLELLFNIFVDNDAQFLLGGGRNGGRSGKNSALQGVGIFIFYRCKLRQDMGN